MGSQRQQTVKQAHDNGAFRTLHQYNVVMVNMVKRDICLSQLGLNRCHLYDTYIRWVTSRPLSGCIKWMYLVLSLLSLASFRSLFVSRSLRLLVRHSSVSPSSGPLRRRRRRRSKTVRCRKNRWPSTSLSALGRILFTPAAAARPGRGAGTRRSERRGRENAGPENEGPRLSDVSLEVFFIQYSIWVAITATVKYRIVWLCVGYWISVVRLLILSIE